MEYFITTLMAINSFVYGMGIVLNEKPNFVRTFMFCSSLFVLGWCLTNLKY